MGENKFVIDNRKHKQQSSLNGFFGDLLTKLGRIKHLNIILGIGGAAIVLFVICGFLFAPTGTAVKEENSADDYLQIEKRLSAVLCEISGAGKVNVMISYAGTSELITATTSNSSEDKTTDSGNSANRTTESRTESLSPVIIRKDGADSPLVVKEIMPDVVGVIVVAEGAGSVAVRMNLLQAVQTLLNISSDKVEIFTMKK